MRLENFPRGFKWLQRIYESQELGRSRDKKAQDKAVRDLSKELSAKIDVETAKLAKKIAGDGDRPGVPTHLPVPQNLTVHDLGIFGFATVDPFYQWKYFGKVQGYEFFGSQNDGFDVKLDNYTQTGTHKGANNSAYLVTKDEDEPFVFDSRLILKTIENLTSGESGTIINYGLPKRYQIRAYKTLSPLVYLTWDTDDKWRIKDYPSNRLFSIGSFSVFPKFLGHFYVKARTKGKGNSYSAFASLGTDAEDRLDTPVMVMPVHNCKQTCTIGDQNSGNWGKPICPTHGAVPWSEIISGTREINHFIFMGVESCDIEVVWEAIETEKTGVSYDVQRGSTEAEDPGIAS